MTDFKRCPNCKTEKVRTDFSGNVAHPDGLSSWCKACTSGYVRKWKSENKAKVRNYHREYHKKYLKTAGGRFVWHKVTAKKRNIPFELSFEQFLKFWGKPCFYCKEIPALT